MSDKLYFIYTRVSKSDYIESLETQLDILKNIAGDPKNNYQYLPETIKCEQESGGNEKRPMFDEILQALLEDSKLDPRDRKYAGVLFFKIDRLFRNFKDFNKVESLMNKGYRFISATETIENTPTGRLLFRMLAGFAIYERDKLSSRESLTYLVNALKNDFDSLWGKTPFGYETEGEEGEKKKLRVNDKEKELINLIYTLRYDNPKKSAKDITKDVAMSPYWNVLVRVIQRRAEKTAQSKVGQSKKRMRVENIMNGNKHPIAETQSDEQAMESLEPIDDKDLMERAVDIVDKCLRNTSTFRYDGHISRTIEINDELVQNYIKSISSWDEKRHRDTFENNTAAWEKDSDFPIGTSVSFNFFVPDLIIVEGKKYEQVQASFKKRSVDTKTPKKIPVFDELLYLQVPWKKSVPMGAYVSQKGTVNYRRTVNGENIEKSEIAIEKAIRKSSLFDNHKNINQYREEIMETLEEENQSEVVAKVRRESVLKMVYEREIRTCESTMKTMVGSPDKESQQEIFEVIKREIARYTQYIKDADENIRKIQEDGRDMLSFYFYLLIGNVSLQKRDDRRLAYTAMFEKIEMSLDKSQLTIHLYAFMAIVLWVPQEFTISLTSESPPTSKPKGTSASRRK